MNIILQGLLFGVGTGLGLAIVMWVSDIVAVLKRKKLAKDLFGKTK